MLSSNPGQRQQTGDPAAPVAAIWLLGVQVHPLTVEQLFEYMLRVIEEDRRAIIANVNVNAMNLADQYPWFRDFLNRAEIVFCDGAGIMLAARLLRAAIPQRITYADWIWQLAGFAEQQGASMFFLGARPGVAERAAGNLQRRYPRLRIAGLQHGYFDQRPDSPENHAVIERINGSGAEILVLGLGMPRQERWLAHSFEHLKVNIALPGGAVFDYVSGDLRRAPRWMTDHHMEWLGRLLIEPRRLWWRYLVGNPRFFWRVLRYRLSQSRSCGGFSR